ncbi:MULTISPECIES: hypothetical protein [unclassified Acinetobacter]|uniref:hypothetical protein n=1 Tax=unclassified Acinetobacter TaxID=196816 RepID=UPI001F4BA961|nr:MULTISPECIES: hypothetical protein [unclassified Acinetobacter]MCH7353256.1 hypothetical protein [Acinetobacter sp. NIPH 2023]MCH7360638.1 hypothetical protein [Acinetobacter sp. NIPH 2024]
MSYLKNVELRFLALHIRTNAEVYKNGADPITLSCNGVVISGRPVAKSVFLEDKQNAILKAFEDAATKSLSAEEIEKQEKEFELVENFHKLFLIDAQTFVGDKIIPSNGGTCMVVNIDSVDAYNFGKLDFNYGS